MLRALERGYKVLGIDIAPNFPLLEDLQQQPSSNPDFAYLSLDLRNYEPLLEALRGCDAIVQLAAYRNPGDFVVQTHNSNVVISWNVLRAAAELGIKRIAQASSVNVITMAYSQSQRIHYFPIDEEHPCLPDEPYGLSKMICELQADTIVRRYPFMRIASLRLHWFVPHRSTAIREDSSITAKDFWGYVQQDSAAHAFLLALEDSDRWSGHEAFFITAPEIAVGEDSKSLRESHYPDVPVKEGSDVSGKKGFFDCSKAERMLGWVHED